MSSFFSSNINHYKTNHPQLVALVLCLFVAIFCQDFNQIHALKETNKSSNGGGGGGGSANSAQQPLANFDKIMQQVNGVKLDGIVDGRMTSNVTNALNEMTLNLRKMVAENRRLQAQMQELLNRVQNATGVNATAVNNLQQQAATVTNLTNPNGPQMNLQTLSTLMPRFSMQRRR